MWGLGGYVHATQTHTTTHYARLVRADAECVCVCKHKYAARGLCSAVRAHVIFSEIAECDYLYARIVARAMRSLV